MTKFVWGPSVSTPRYFDIWMKYAYVGFGNKGRRYPALGYDRDGIGQGSASVVLNDFDEGMPLPNSLDISWLSNVDRKIYKGNFEFSEELNNKILDYFRKGYKDYDPRDNTTSDITYSGINITIIPGGRVILYLTGVGRIACLDTVFQCNVREVKFREYYTYDGYNTIDEYVDKCNAEEDGPVMLSLLGQYGRDYIYGLWDRYMERFNYEVKIEFENEETVVNPNNGYKYTNGEMFKNYDGIKVDMLARIKSTAFVWNVADTVYTGHFFFNENEVLEYFDKAYGKNRNRKGEFIIKVSKYNNKFDIFLKVGEQEYKFEKTQIHVFRRRPEDDKGYNFYDNYRGEEVKHYIGE